MIRASKNSSLHRRRGDPAPIVIPQHETRGDYGSKPVPDSSRVPADSEMANPINTSWASVAALLAAVLAVVPVVVLAVVLVAVLAVVLAVVLVAGAELYFVSYTRCDLFSTLMSSLPFRFN